MDGTHLKPTHRTLSYSGTAAQIKGEQNATKRSRGFNIAGTGRKRLLASNAQSYHRS